MFRTNEIFGGTYQIIKEIGRGGAGVVYLALHLRLQKYVVIKRIKTKHQDLASLRVETDILKNLHHPSLPQIYDFIMSEGEVYTVIDYVEGKDFSQLGCGPQVIPPELAMKWFRQLMEVLQYMHTRRYPIIHSDIKPANIMLRPDGEICLIDFNISLEGNQQGMIMGYSDIFASPEQVEMAMMNQKGIPINYVLDVRTDLYSAAATMYYMITGIRPNIRGEYPRLGEIDGLPYPPGFLSVLDRCLEVNRDKRFSSATKVLKALDNIKKQDIRYRKYLVGQGLSWLGCALLISTGIFLMVRGNQRNIEKQYQNQYARFYDSAMVGDDYQTISLGYDILNNSKYNKILKKNPSGKAMILHTIGEAYYRQEDYEGAAEAFEEATVEADADDVNIGNYYLDYAMALAECGEYTDARNKMVLAGNTVSNASFLLIDAKIAQESGNVEQCKQLIQQLLSLPGSTKECIQGCLIAAESVGMKSSEGISWMEYGLQYEQSSMILRPLTSACMSMVSSETDRNRQQTWVSKAQQYYVMLLNQPDVKEEDYLGYGISFYVSGDSRTCFERLKQLADRGSNDYRVYLYLALSAYDLQDIQTAKTYCRMALDLTNNMSEVEKQKADEGMLIRLSSLSAEIGL